ncbi:hypothetical protein GCM10009528_07060 [Kineococcus aurantiacus]
MIRTVSTGLRNSSNTPKHIPGTLKHSPMVAVEHPLLGPAGVLDRLQRHRLRRGRQGLGANPLEKLDRHKLAVKAVACTHQSNFQRSAPKSTLCFGWSGDRHDGKFAPLPSIGAKAHHTDPYPFSNTQRTALVEDGNGCSWSTWMVNIHLCTHPALHDTDRGPPAKADFVQRAFDCRCSNHGPSSMQALTNGKER